MSTIILDPSKLSSKSIDQQLITSLAFAVDSNCDEQHNHDQFNSSNKLNSKY